VAEFYDWRCSIPNFSNLAFIDRELFVEKLHAPAPTFVWPNLISSYLLTDLFVLLTYSDIVSNDKFVIVNLFDITKKKKTKEWSSFDIWI
jgi:hypothetical protein